MHPINLTSITYQSKQDENKKGKDSSSRAGDGSKHGSGGEEDGEGGEGEGEKVRKRSPGRDEKSRSK